MDRDTTIIDLRLNKCSLREISNTVGISHETVRRILRVKLGTTKLDHYDKLLEYAKSNRGGLVTSSYQGIDYSYVFRCKYNHIFSSKYYHMVKNNTFCTVCSQKSRRNRHLVEIRLHAVKKGGKCLSEEFITANDKYSFICYRGHSWEATWGNVRNKGSWCPKCAYIDRSTNKKSQPL